MSSKITALCHVSMWILIFILLAVIAFTDAGCTTVDKHIGYWAEETGCVNTSMGRFTTYLTNSNTIKHLWDSRTGDRWGKHDVVHSFVDMKAKEIWYTHGKYLKQELENLESVESLRRAHERDVERGYPKIRPREM